MGMNKGIWLLNRKKSKLNQSIYEKKCLMKE